MLTFSVKTWLDGNIFNSGTKYLSGVCTLLVAWYSVSCKPMRLLLSPTLPVQRPDHHRSSIRGHQWRTVVTPWRNFGDPWQVRGNSLANRDDPGYSPDVLKCLKQSGWSGGLLKSAAHCSNTVAILVHVYPGLRIGATLVVRHDTGVRVHKRYIACHARCGEEHESSSAVYLTSCKMYTHAMTCIPCYF